ncbi:hypothetical protein [Streptomyces sp. NPDC001843]|uniref:hypothetical protein n=1 Tax=Streptomyces sp. NPDC001843 TaxID=3364617 RepID=UPI00368F4FC4
MSADRETGHDMTQTDIALLLADAADEVEIGIAPVQAVIRAGRRRRARRWAVAAATTLVLAGSTGGTLAVTGLPGGGHGGRGASVATRPSSPEARHVYEPQVTEVSRGTDHGKEWSVSVQVWGAPRTLEEAARQYDTMKDRGFEPAEGSAPADLVGMKSFFVLRSHGSDRPREVMFNTTGTPERFTGTDLEDHAASLGEISAEAPLRLVVGRVAKTAREVTCQWNDGRTTSARLAGPVPTAHDGESLIRPVSGYPGANWFVCVAPDGATYKDAKVTK